MTHKVITTITIDERTKKLVDHFAKKRSLSRSSSIRMILNEYLSNLTGEQ
jgi:metal-responsive CopG/Arc/MetJ family transcriptional regulator